MNWSEFVRRWRDSSAGERQGSQTQFNELCALLGEPGPNDDPNSGDYYAFEFGAAKSGGGDGFADVAFKDHFGWEYKGKRKDLGAAYKQLLDYHEALGQPPLLVVSDMERFEVHTKWAQMESWTYSFSLPDLLTADPVEVRTPTGTPKSPHQLSARQVLKALFEDVERLKPNRPRDDITKEAAADFEKIAVSLRKWKDAKGEQLVDDLRIARLITKLIFCMFATDVALLPKFAFSDLIKDLRDDPPAFRASLSELFRCMEFGESFGGRTLKKFNGWLFDDHDVPEWFLGDEIRVLERLDAMNWTDVEPAIFGTLFERVLDKGTRAKLGAHYTSRDDIELLVKPVLMASLEREWEGVRESAIAAIQKARDRGASEQTRRERLRETVEPFLGRLGNVQVLDPACGSGNFLYVSLALLKRLEKEVLAFAEVHGVELGPRVHPRQLHGIEVNPYAHELASIVIWIGFLQWKYQNQIDLAETEPILEKLDQIQLKDAILDLSDPADPKEPEWPSADVIVGNPPFLGGKRLRNGTRDAPGLGDDYVDSLHRVWSGRVSKNADLCCYWFEKAREQHERNPESRVGLLATNSIGDKFNRPTLERIAKSTRIFFAESNRPWTLNGANVRIAMVGFGSSEPDEIVLDGRAAPKIHTNLSAGIDVTKATVLAENKHLAFQGIILGGPFEIDGVTARRMFMLSNPNGRSNTDVLYKWLGGDSLDERLPESWVIAFRDAWSETEAARYEGPFELVKARYSVDQGSTNPAWSKRAAWWRLHRSRESGLRSAIKEMPRYLCTPRDAKHRIYVWVEASWLVDTRIVAFARDDDYFHGVLASRIHACWSEANTPRLGKGNTLTYSHTTCFETFPLPWPPGKEPRGDPLVSAIGEAAKELNELRERWLNPLPLDGLALPESELKRRTLTNLYNERPQWLKNAHRALDEAVFAAYGWDPKLEDGDVLAKLLALNFERGAGVGG